MINLWSKGVAIPIHNVMSQLLHQVLYTRCYLNIVGECKCSTPWPYFALAICTYNPTNKCDNCLWHSTYWCCYYGNKVLHNACNICIYDMNVLIPWAYSPRALGIQYQANTSTYVPHFLFRHTTMREKKNFVHLNLCIALLLGCIVFVGGLETAKDNKVSFQIYCMLI